MDLNRLKAQLQVAIPAEIYKVEPGQIALFVSNGEIDQRTVIKLSAVFQYFRKLYKDNNVNISIVPTDNELLFGLLAGRNPQETGIPYKVAISNWDTIAGFASEYFGEEIDKIIEQVPESGVGMTTRISISATELPIIVSLDPKDNPENNKEYPSDFSESPMELLQNRPEPGTKEEKSLIKKEEAKQEALLRECYVLDVDLDIAKVQKKVNAAINDPTDYQLSFKVKRNTLRPNTIEYKSFDIYVADGEKYKLNFTAMEKAIYLTFMLYPAGIRVKETFDDFRHLCIKIYSCMPPSERCEKEEGLRWDTNAMEEVYLTTLRGYLSTIRTKVSKHVLNPKTAIDFAIEGYKDEAFSIRRSTPEIIAQIKEWFRL